MNLEQIRAICHSFPAVQESIKWGHDLAFTIGDKMFCVVGLDQTPTTASFKVTADEFDELSVQPNFMPAPYVARYKWVLLADITTIHPDDCTNYLRQSYELVRDKLPAKVRKELI